MLSPFFPAMIARVTRERRAKRSFHAGRAPVGLYAGPKSRRGRAEAGWNVAKGLFSDGRRCYTSCELPQGGAP